MSRQTTFIAALALSASLMGPALALAGGVQVRFNREDPDKTPFPSDLFTVSDGRQNTGLRVALPFPDDLEQRSNRELIKAINKLDGFNLQPRISIPFTGAIDVSTFSSETVFLVRLGSTPDEHSDDDLGEGGFEDDGSMSERVIGINQVVWDPETNTLHVESE